MGWNGSDGKRIIPDKHSKNKSLLFRNKIFIAISLFLTIGVVFWFIFNAGLISCEKNSLADSQGKYRDLLERDKSDVSTKKLSSISKENDISHSKEAKQENINGENLNQPPIDSGSLPTPPPPPPLQTSHFKSASDQVISMAVNTEGSIAPIPLDNNFDTEFKNSLKQKIVINDDDPEDVKKAKENVIAIRKELKALMDQGMSPREALEAHRDEVNRIFETRAMVVQEARKIENQSGREEADEFLKLANDYLQSKGMEAVRLRRRD
jgi:hypothetical protein